MGKTTRETPARPPWWQRWQLARPGRERQGDSPPIIADAGQGSAPKARNTTKDRGDAAEDRALAWLQARGLELVERNHRLAGGPNAPGAELDLVMHERASGTLVFVEVRRRPTIAQALASVDARKQARLVRAAQHVLMARRSVPPCRFDVVALTDDPNEAPHWVVGAFELPAAP